MTGTKRNTRGAAESAEETIWHRLVTFARGWTAFVGLVALGNALQCFVSPEFVWTKIYSAPNSGATPLTARTYGLWTLLAGIIRLLFARNPHSRDLYVATQLSFLVAFAHFASEFWIFESGEIGFGMLSPLIVSSASLILLLLVKHRLLSESQILTSTDEDEIGLMKGAIFKGDVGDETRHSQLRSRTKVKN